MNRLFKYFDLIKTKREITETVSAASLELKYTLEFWMTGEEKLLLEIPKSLFEEKSIEVYVNSVPKNSYNEFVAPFKDDILDELKVTIIINYKSKNDKWEITLYDYNSLIKMLKEFLNSPISYIYGLKDKISIQIYKEYEFIYESTIFNISNINTNIKNKEIDLNTINFLNNTINKNLILGSLPGVITCDDNIHQLIFPYVNSIKSYLNILANSNNNTHYHFFGKQILEIHLDSNITPNISKNINQDLSNSIKYIYSDLKNSDQKLTFYRKVFTEFNKSSNNLILDSNLDSNFFREILAQTQYVYDSYEDGEISTYIKEKKEIVKEYLSISKEIIQSSNNLKNNLLKNLITISALFITNFLLKANELESTKTIFVAMLLFLFILIILSIFHDLEQLSNFKNRIQTLQTYFKFISKESKFLQTDTEYLLKRELGTLKFMTISPLIIYIVLFFIIILMLLA